MIGKRKDSRYESGKRSKSWLKVKPTHTADFVIGGYTKGKGSREALGSLLVGYWERGKLKYASHVGSGFDDRSLTDVKKKLDKLKIAKCPFDEKPVVNAPVTWVEPVLVAELQFHEWTERRLAARAGVPAPARRHRSESRAANRSDGHCDAA